MQSMSATGAFGPFTKQIRERTGWIITDGRAGPLSTTTGVAEALGLKFEHKRIAARATWSVLPLWSILDPRGSPGNDGGAFARPWPELAIAAGRQTFPYLQALRRASEGATFTVILQHTGTRSNIADLTWCPMHEGLAGPNVISTLTSPHVMRPAELAAMRKRRAPEIAALSGPLIAVLLGGPNRDFPYGAEAQERLGLCLQNLADKGASFLITPSRRTTASLFRTVTHATRGAERIIWTGGGVNPYWSFLAHSDVTIVTADSLNMTSEACVTGRPVYVFNPEGGSEGMRRFHAGLRQYGATRTLTADIHPLETWSYRPLDAAPKIAAEIACRFYSVRTTSARPRAQLPARRS
jgi:mitochondrial fission protein ELM1